MLFRTTASAASLKSNLEIALERRFKIPLVVVVRSHAQFRKVVDDAPDGFGTQPKTYHSDVIFLKKPLTSKQAMKVVALREGVDQAWPGNGVIYFAASERSTHAEPDVAHCRHTRVSADDHPQLGHHDEAPRTARRVTRRDEPG